MYGGKVCDNTKLILDDFNFRIDLNLDKIRTLIFNTDDTISIDYNTIFVHKYNKLYKKKLTTSSNDIFLLYNMDEPYYNLVQKLRKNPNTMTNLYFAFSELTQDEAIIKYLETQYPSAILKTGLNLEKEIKMIKYLEEKKICRNMYPKYYIHDNNNIIIERMECDLYYFVTKYHPTLLQKVKIMEKMLCILKCLADNNIFYTDIKLQNFLIKWVNDEHIVYIADFDNTQVGDIKLFAQKSGMFAPSVTYKSIFTNKQDLMGEQYMCWCIGVVFLTLFVQADYIKELIDGDNKLAYKIAFDTIDDMAKKIFTFAPEKTILKNAIIFAQFCFDNYLTTNIANIIDQFHNLYNGFYYNEINEHNEQLKAKKFFILLKAISMDKTSHIFIDSSIKKQILWENHGGFKNALIYAVYLNCNVNTIDKLYKMMNSDIMLFYEFDENNKKAFMYSIINDNADICQYILNAQPLAQQKMKNRDDKNAIMYAKEKMKKLLISRGIN
jgi:serine/threonine protein kinase